MGCSDVINDQIMKQFGRISWFFLWFYCNASLLFHAGTDGRLETVSRENRLLIFFMRIMLGLPLSAIGCLFGITVKMASKIFYTIFATLYSKTKARIFWPWKEAIKETVVCRMLLEIKINFINFINFNQFRKTWALFLHLNWWILRIFMINYLKICMTVILH